MKLVFLFLNIIPLLVFGAAAHDTITVKHTYQGKNIFVRNSFVEKKNSFCTLKVLVNDSTVLENVQSAAYEINLSYLPINTTAKIQIIHQEGCKPVVMTPIICFPERAFQFVSLTITEKEWSFTTKGEAKNETIIIEYFKNNNWVQLKEIPCKGSAIINNYTVPPQNISGNNKVRLKHINGDGYITYSKEVEYISQQ